MEKLLSAINIPSPIHSFNFSNYPEREILIKRDDLIHEAISGNKWRKLKYNIDFALKDNYEGILSFGGAFSNHLYATAAACNLAGLKFKAILRANKLDLQNPTVKFLLKQNAELSLLDYTKYREAKQASGLADYQDRFPNYHVVPEGGSNHIAYRGVREIVEEVYQQIGNNKLIFVCGVGSGTTITGIAKALNQGDKALGLLAVNDSSLEDKIRYELTAEQNQRLSIDKEAHLGGFAKVNEGLLEFVNNFYDRTKIPIDPIYNGKVLYRLSQMIENEILDKEYKIIVIHTGGLQGNAGFHYRYPGKLTAGLTGL